MPPFLSDKCHLIRERGFNLLGNDGVCAKGGGDARGTSLVDPLRGDALGWEINISALYSNRISSAFASSSAATHATIFTYWTNPRQAPDPCSLQCHLHLCQHHLGVPGPIKADMRVPESAVASHYRRLLFVGVKQQLPPEITVSISISISISIMVACACSSPRTWWQG